MTEEFLVDLIRASTGERTWDDDPRTGISLAKGLLYVTQSPRAHREIEDLLGRLPY